MKLFYTALLFSFFLLAQSCSVAPVIERKNLKTRLPDRYGDTESGANSTKLCWHASFPSPNLQADVMNLFADNFEVKAVRGRLEQAVSLYKQSRSKLFPSFNLGLNYANSAIRENGNNNSGYTGTLTGILSWAPDLWGRLAARQEAGRLMVDFEKALALQTALDMQRLLVESWVSHHAACKLEKLLLEQQEINRKFLELTELRLAQGQGSAVDVLQQRGRLVTAKRQLPEVVSEKYLTANAYRVLTGGYPDNESLPRDRWFVPSKISTIAIPRSLMIDRPDLRAAFLKLKAADHKVAAAIGDTLPRLSLGLSLSATRSSISAIGDESILRLGADLLAPLFDGGRLQARVEQRRGEVMESLALLENSLRVAVREVEDSIIKEQSLFDKKRLLLEEKAVARETVEKATIEYVHGRKSFLVVLSANVKLQNVEQQELFLEKDLLINRGRILYALGAKWNEHCEKPKS